MTIEERILAVVGAIEAANSELRRAKKVLLDASLGRISDDLAGDLLLAAARRASDRSQDLAQAAEALANMIQPRLPLLEEE